MVDDMITPKGVILSNMITPKEVILSDMILGFPSIVGNVGCLTLGAGSLPKLRQTYNWTD